MHLGISALLEVKLIEIRYVLKEINVLQVQELQFLVLIGIKIWKAKDYVKFVPLVSNVLLQQFNYVERINIVHQMLWIQLSALRVLLISS